MGRSRGGVKVPNVKLRPALPNPTTKPRRKVVDSDDEEPVDSGVVLQADRAIFRGVMVCASGIKEKRDVFELVRRMGGSHTADFTDFTTHLITSQVGSEKYRCALERRIPVLTSSWIYEAHERWLAGEVFSIHDMVDAHRLPPFENVTICITGNEVADLRNRIHKQIRLYGGNSVKSLDRTCTHLLCSSDQTDKVSYANRINAEREIARSRPDGNDIPPPIHILWEEWFWDCLYVKGHLEYDRYHITNPRPKPVSESVMVSPPISRLSLPDDAGPSTLPQAVPLSSLLSGPPDSIAPAKRIKHAATREWEAIMKPRGYVNQKQQSSQGMDLDRHESTTSSSPMKKSWVSGSFDGLTAPPGFSRRSPVKKAAMKNVTEPSLGSKAVSAVRLLPEDDAPSSRPTGNAAPDTFLGKFSKATAFSSEESSVKTAQIANDNSKSVFSGLTFRVLGDAVCDNVFTAITQSSGTIRQIGSPDFYIVRLVGGSELMHDYTPDEQARFRTECWLERCLFERRLCPVEENITYAPLSVKLPILGTSHYLVALSGLDTSQKTWVTRLLRLLDLKVSQCFSVQCTHLLCPTRAGIKCKKAEEWNIPIVDLDWLTGIAKGAMIAPGHPLPARTELSKKMEASMKDMQLGLTKRSPVNEGESIYSPVFKITSPARRTGPPRPASPTSPSPQRKQRLPEADVAPTEKPTVLALSNDSRAFSSLPSTSDLTSATFPDTEFSVDAGSSMRITTTTPHKNNDNVTLPIPSSATPSPFPSRISGNTPTSSKLNETKISAQTASALQRNIGVVLGSKRAAEEDQDTDTAQSDGPRKRPRRPRAKNTSGTPKKLELSSSVLPFEQDQYGDAKTIISTAFPALDKLLQPVKGFNVNYAEPAELEEERPRRVARGGTTASTTESKPVPNMKPRRSGRQRA